MHRNPLVVFTVQSHFFLQICPPTMLVLKGFHQNVGMLLAAVIIIGLIAIVDVEL